MDYCYEKNRVNFDATQDCDVVVYIILQFLCCRWICAADIVNCDCNWSSDGVLWLRLSTQVT